MNASRSGTTSSSAASAARLARTACGSSPTCPPRFSPWYGASPTPGPRPVNAIRTPGSSSLETNTPASLREAGGRVGQPARGHRELLQEVRDVQVVLDVVERDRARRPAGPHRLERVRDDDRL